MNKKLLFLVGFFFLWMVQVNAQETTIAEIDINDEVKPISICQGTILEDVISQLVEEITIKDSDEETHTVQIDWTITDYDTNTTGEFIAIGTFELPTGVIQTDPETDLEVNTTVTVNPLPEVTCPKDMVVNSIVHLIGMPEGGEFSGEGIVGNTFDPHGLENGDYIITFYYTDENECDNYCEFIITVDIDPIELECPKDLSVCIDKEEFILSGASHENGEYSGIGVSEGKFNPAEAGLGTHEITYTYDDIQCSFNITVNDIPEINCPENITLTTEDTIVLTGATPEGGVYSGKGVTDGKFDPKGLENDLYIITYTYKDENACENYCNFVIILDIQDPEPVEIICPDDISICIYDDEFELTGATPEGGIYSGKAVVDDIFTPNIAGVGVHKIVYTADEGECNFNIVVKPEFAKIKNVSDIKLCLGTPEEDAALLLEQETIIIDSEGKTHIVALEWTILDYVPYESGSYTATATFELPETVCSQEEPDKIQATITLVEEFKVDLGKVIDGCKGSEVVITAPVGNYYIWSNDTHNQRIVVTEPGVYTVTVIQHTCQATDSVEVVFNEVPDDFSLGNDIYACIGDTVILTVPDVEEDVFLWSTGEETESIKITEAGKYSLSIFNEHKCSATAHIYVEFNEFLIIVLHDQDTLFACKNEVVELDPNLISGNALWSWGDDNTSTDTVLSVTESGWYYIDITTENCQGNDSIYVHFYELPDIDLGPNISFCKGFSDVITAPEGYMYMWSTGDSIQQITVDTAGIYTCTIIDMNGCINYDSVKVTVHKLPVVDLGSDLIIDEDQIVLLSSLAGYEEYLWSTSETGNYIYIEGAELGIGEHIISVTITSKDGCKNSDSINIKVVEGLMVNQNIADNLKIYPNPASNKVYVELNKFDSQYSILMINAKNQIITKHKIIDSITKIDVSNISPGPYFIIIYNNNERAIKKVIVE